MRAALLLAACLAPLPAAAQSYQCSPPSAAPPVPVVRQDGPSRTMPVTGYTVALSWSPEFCRTRGGDRSHARQCSGRTGRFGLIVHGLWPDGGRSWPQWCAPRVALTGIALRRNLCVTPSARLIARQWAKHGACMTRDPARYLAMTRIVARRLGYPDLDRLSRQEPLTAGDIREALAAANRGLEPAHVGVVLNERGWLREVRICLNRRFRPGPCDARRYGASDNASAKIWRGL